MKTIVLMSGDNFKFTHAKSILHEKYKSNIVFKGTNYIDLYINYENIRVIFKKININRPADLYKYKDDAIFVYIRGFMPKDSELISELNILLRKKRDFIGVKDIGEFIDFIFNQKQIAYYEIDNDYNLVKKFSFKYPFGDSNEHLITNIIVTDDYEKALAHRRKYIMTKINKVKEQIEDKQNELNLLMSVLNN